MGEFYVVYDNEVKIYSKKLMEASDSFKLNGLKYNGLTIAPTRNLKLVGVFRLTVSSKVQTKVFLRYDQAGDKDTVLFSCLRKGSSGGATCTMVDQGILKTFFFSYSNEGVLGFVYILQNK